MKLSTVLYYQSEKLGFEKALELVSKAGFDAIDYGRTNYWYAYNQGLFAYNDTDFENFFKRDRELIDKNNLFVSQIHAPFPTYPDNISELDFMLYAIERSFIAAQILGSPYVVMHGALRCGWDPDDDPQKTKELNLRIFDRLLKMSKTTGVKLALENMLLEGIPTSTPEDIIDYIDSMHDDNFVACLDTGHAHYTGYTPGDFARKLGHRLKVLHVHDNSTNHDAHTTPFCGTIDWADFSRALKEINYSGTFSYETDSLPRQLPAEFIEDLLKFEYKLAKYIISLCNS
ncbi:MAG: sugar phosphate isomerase/epimerase [Clostridia bacterium]|nr:sugar phosphate isomerase/epimerase [Clostridia bacterium]